MQKLLLLPAALILLLLSLHTWMSSELLNSENFSTTARQTLESPAVSEELATKVVDELWAKSNPEERIEKALPEELEFLSGPASLQLQSLSTGLAENFLQSPAILTLLEDSIRLSHKQAIDTISGQSNTLALKEEGVIIKLQPVLLALSKQIGLGEKQVKNISPDAIQVTVYEGSAVKQAQTGWKTWQMLGWLLPLLFLLLFVIIFYCERRSPWRSYLFLAASLFINFVLLLFISLLVFKKLLPVPADPLQAAITDRLSILLAGDLNRVALDYFYSSFLLIPFTIFFLPRLRSLRQRVRPFLLFTPILFPILLLLPLLLLPWQGILFFLLMLLLALLFLWREEPHPDKTAGDVWQDIQTSSKNLKDKLSQKFQSSKKKDEKKEDEFFII